MTKSKGLRFWVTVTVIALIISGVLFFPQTNSVRAMLGNAHVAEIFIRFMNEIVLKSPAGEYYVDLSKKHMDDLNRIYNDEPGKLDHREKLVQIIQMFTPGMEALLDGKGDTVQITKEQISILKTELDWIASVAGPPLQEDIEKEQKRFPLDNFIGMTMKEALDFVNSNWIPGTQVVPLATPTRMPMATASIPICLVGPDTDCLEKPTLVPNSNGLWAYYVHHDVYFEYPSAWKIRKDINTILRIIPFPDSSQRLDILDIVFVVLPTMSAEQNNAFIQTQPLEHAKWKQPVFAHGFEGIEFLWGDSNSSAILEISLYNEEYQTTVDLQALISDSQILGLINNPDTVSEIFADLQHIIESIRIWKP